MEQTINVVVTCTKRKTRLPDPSLRLGEVRGETPEELAHAWLRRVQASKADPVRAEDLYSGDHWSVVRSFPEAVRGTGRRINLWICSAGYGLIPADCLIAPYSATFSVPHPDSVSRNFPGSTRDVFGRWWRVLAEWVGPVPEAARTISRIIEQWPDSPVLVIGSAPYLRAMQDDLIQASRALPENAPLAILSAGTESLPGLESRLVRFDARLRQVLGGGMMSLNVRAAREILRQGWGLAAAELNAAMQGLHEGLEKNSIPERTPRSDEEVEKFIREELEKDRSVSWTPMLRKLRDELGWACEQKRFKALYLSVRGSLEKTQASL